MKKQWSNASFFCAIALGCVVATVNCGGGRNNPADVDGGIDGSTVVSVDPFACTERTRDKLESVAGRPCNTVQDCATGMNCDLVAGGVCAFACAANSDCQGDNVCSCAGQCIPNQIKPDDACGRVYARLQSAATLDEECGSDTDCPKGAHCDGATNRCRFACLTNEDCGASGACDCDGRCAAPPARADVLPILSTYPSVLEIALPDNAPNVPLAPIFEERPIDIELKGTIAGAAGLPLVNVEAGTGLQIRCADAAPQKFCAAKGWFAAPNDSASTNLWRTRVFVSPIPGAIVTSNRTWTVRFLSEGIAQSPVGLTVQYSDRNAPVGPSEWTPAAEIADGGYRGLLHLTPPDGATIVIPVRAVSANGRIVLHDETRLVSKSGILPVSRSKGATERFEYYAPTAVDLRMSGRIAAFTTNEDEIKRNPKEGGLEGRFKFTVVGTVKPDGKLGMTVNWNGRFSLAPDASVATCAADSTCGPGTTCKLGICAAGPAFVPVESFASTLQHSDRSAWLAPERVSLIRATYWPPPSFVCASSSLAARVYVAAAVDVNSGQTLCSSKDVGGAFPLFAPTSNGLSTLLQSCLSETRRIAPPVPSAGFGSLLAKLGGDDFLAASQCVGMGNFLSALEISREEDFGTDHAWLLAQWAQVHSFIARQGVAEETINRVVLGEGKGADATAVTYPKALDALERAWGLIAADSISSPLGAVSEWTSFGSTALPDYRTKYIALASRAAQLGNAGHDQKAGLAPALLFALADHLNLVSAFLSDDSRKVYGVSSAIEKQSVLDRYAESIRSTTLIQGLAHSTYNRAVEACASNVANCEGKTTPLWEARWRESIAALVAARSSVIQKAELYRQGRNPLGIQDEDTPLYFGDVQGEVGRFFAASSYLLEQAEKAVVDTSASLATARSAWIESRNANVQDQQQRMQMGFRIEDLERQYGQPIIDACGLVGTTASQLWKDIDAGKFYPQSCHVDAMCAGTATSPDGIQAPLYARLDERAAKLQLCKIAFSSNRLQVTDGIKTCISGSSGGAAVLLDLVDTFTLESSPITLKTLGIDAGVTCGGKTFDAAELWADQGMALVPAAEQEAAKQACESRFGGSYVPVPKFDPTCYRGQIGSAAARILTAKQEVNTALSRLQTAEVSFEKTWELCQLKIDNNSMRLAAQNTLNKQREAWRDAKKLARDLERVADTAQGALSGATHYASIGAGLGAIGGSVVPGAGTVVGAGIGAATGALIGGALSFFGSSARQKQKKLDDELKLAETEYATLLENLSANENLVACLNDADVQKSAIITEIEAIKTQAMAVDGALIDFSNLQRANLQKILEGVAVLKKERERNWGGYAHHFWFDEKVQTFQREFPWAQRLSYLALRAVEYELQQTLMQRSNIVSANHPVQLSAALTALHQQRDNLRVSGARPAQAIAVLSLRDDLLAVADNSRATTGIRNISSAEGFAAELSSTGAEVRSSVGKYLGQGFSFSLTSTTRGLSRTSLPNRCAERIWQVTATIVGDGVAPGTTRVPVQIRKRNTFSSQLCGGKGAVQSASIQPSKNLLDPASLGGAEEKADFTDAAVLAPLNVPRSMFESDAFNEGVSAEMAGYGFYGDYVVFIPKAALAGVNLAKIEDILLRFTYLSVDDT